MTSPYEAAEDILRGAKAALEAENMTIDAMRNRRINPDWIAEIDEQLTAVEPFTAMKGKRVSMGVGGFRTADQMAGHWCVEQILKGAELETIVASAAADLAANSIDLYEVVNLKGAKVEKVTEIAPGAWLYPNAEVPTNGNSEIMFTMPFMPGLRDQHWGLLQKYSVSPAMFEGERTPADHEALKKGDEDRTAFRRDLRWAMILACDHAIEMPGRYSVAVGDSILMTEGGYYYGLTDPFVPMVTDFDVPKVQCLLNLIHRMDGFDSFGIAVERLSRSRTNYNDINSAIDLGMAAEVILMHGEPSKDAEIANKLGTRAAWLMGTDLASRKAIKSKMSTLYSARSDAVHGGRITEKTAKKFDGKAMDEFVRGMLVKLLERGRFPDWNDLTLGGTGDPAATIDATPLELPAPGTDQD
ncbi:HEPN domain-containing protein [Rhizobium sp. PP-CC-3G-465]|uniref:HEPN domain-containing protein n=1 Tax=Rhizobium sp. PP-CC-3G-465 TaxID=2135648 RepID=UPI00104768A5|nr:hypothetical protein C8J33_1345 [Rhizobium sp. PP-CC-3G-465]